jgi:putative endonuclease
MPYFVYILLSKKDNKLYVGCSHNVAERIIEHNYGKVSATKNRRPLVVIYTKEFKDKGEAFNRERYLKSLWSARFKKKILEEYKQSSAE